MPNKNEDFLKENNLTPLFYRDKLVFTCMLVNSNGNAVSKGIAICSPKDQFRLSEAKNKSLGRAIAAAKNKDTTQPINLIRRFPYTTPNGPMTESERSLITAQFITKHKSIVNPELTDREKAMILRHFCAK